jgi:hypothetical protein
MNYEYIALGLSVDLSTYLKTDVTLATISLRTLVYNENEDLI